MSRFVLDTNILLAYLRPKEDLINRINKELDLEHLRSENFISVVTKAEIMALARRNGWGEKKESILSELLSTLIQVDITAEPDVLIQAYIEIDIFSLGKHPTKKLEGSAIKMGKNDLWIAATAYALNAKLITTDGGFNHLNGHFLDVQFYKV